MSAVVAILVFIYGIIEKDFWWALWACFASFLVAFLIEMTYMAVAFTAFFNALSALANAASQM